MDHAVNLIFHSAKSQRRYLLVSLESNNCIVCSHTKVVLTLIELVSSTVWRSFHSLAAKNFYEELDINNVCVLDFSISLIYFSIGKITTAALVHSFRVWYVQCLAKRITLNFSEFIHSKVWRSYSFAVKDFMKNLTTTTSATTAFVSKLCKQ